jgi:hypothetical protein
MPILSCATLVANERYVSQESVLNLLTFNVLALSLYVLSFVSAVNGNVPGNNFLKVLPSTVIAWL